MTDAVLNSAVGAKSFVLAGEGPWRMGRATDCDICIDDDPGCSRQQARIERDGEDFVIIPVSRSAPMSLDGRAVEGETRLLHGSVIGFASQRLVFRCEGAATVVGAGIAAYTQVAAGLAGLATGAPGAGAAAYVPIGGGITVGRQPMPGQAVFDHPAISRRHAAFEARPDGVVLRDLGSTNGTYVNGVRVVGVRRLARGDRIDIGPFQLVFDGSGLQSSSRSGNAELNAVGICKDVLAGGRRSAPLRLLHGVCLKIRPRTLTCIMGASGSGKSTLMNILAGRNRPSEGHVLLNGQDLHENFAALKQDVAFVPQQDVLHEQLTLRQALDYAAQLRLPPDTSTEQRVGTVEAAARSVDLFERLDTRIEALSGGQKKRASLASEILNRPSLLFLDEVTSGLDERTDWEIMGLLRRLAEEGMTIVAVTHTLANVEEFCHDVICMGRGGHLTFAGSPADALAFFGARRLGELFNCMEEGGAAVWSERFAARPGATASTPASAAAPAHLRYIPEPRAALAARAIRQFLILLSRNRRILQNDSRTLMMAAAQSLLIGGLMGYSFSAFGGNLASAAAGVSRHLAGLQCGIERYRGRTGDLPARA